MAQYYQVHHHESRHIFATTLATLVSAIGGLIVLTLISRFILTLFEVDRLQPFANFIYTVSYPFVAPFFTLFNYQQQMGVLKFEYQTLLAIVFWSLATWFIANSINIVKEDE